MANPNLNSMLGPHIVICSQIVPKLVLNGDFKHCIIVFIATVLFGICVPFVNAFICDLFSVSSYLCFFQSASTYQCTYPCWSVTVLCSNLYPLYVDVTLFTLFISFHVFIMHMHACGKIFIVHMHILKLLVSLDLMVSIVLFFIL